MRRAKLVVGAILVLAGLTLLATSAFSWVRVPRDSPIIIHGRVQQPGSFDPSRSAPPATPPLGILERPPPTPPVGVGPGYRPLWVPGTYVWTGYTATWVPG